MSAWRIAGSYYESCNCQAVCPCRRVNGRPGGRSTYGICDFALSWQIEDGSAGGVDLSGLRAVLVARYDDDEAGSPWDYYLYLDERDGLPALHPGVPMANVRIMVPDVDAYWARAVAGGGRVLAPIADRDYGLEVVWTHGSLEPLGSPGLSAGCRQRTLKLGGRTAGVSSTVRWRSDDCGLGRRGRRLRTTEFRS